MDDDKPDFSSTCPSEQSGKTLWINKCAWIPLCPQWKEEQKSSVSLPVFLEFDPVLFEKSQLIVYGIICITLHVAECRFCVLLTSALVFVFFKTFSVLSEVSSGAVWDCRWWDTVFPSLLPVTLLDCQGIDWDRLPPPPPHQFTFTLVEMHSG